MSSLEGFPFDIGEACEGIYQGLGRPQSEVAFDYAIPSMICGADPRFLHVTAYDTQIAGK